MAQHDLTNNNNDAFQVDVKSITVHPGYICNKPKDDIAILELESTLTWSSSVVPACFPVAADHEEYSKFSGVLATVAGWGWTNEDSSKGKILAYQFFSPSLCFTTFSSHLLSKPCVHFLVILAL